MIKVSLIATVYNDAEGVRCFLDRMEAQTQRPDEIVICDAGSGDGTWELLKVYEHSGKIPLTAFQEPRCRPAKGRNLAAAVARNDILAVTDIGCDWDATWFQELVAPFEIDPGLEVVLGSWTVRWNEQLTGWAKADYVLQNGLDFHATPESHSANRAIAYRKDFYLRLGGLPEDLSFAADDMVLALLIQRVGKAKAAASIPRCYWSRPQTLQALLNESRRNALGDGEADIHRGHFVLTMGRLVAELLLLLGGVLAALMGRSWLFALGVMGIGLLPTALRLQRLRRRQQFFARQAKPALFSHVVALDYTRKFWSWRGYITGWIQGSQKCRECRGRLRAYGISPW